MKLILLKLGLFLVLVLHGATSEYAIAADVVGQGFYLPEFDLSAKNLLGGHKIFNSMPVNCLSKSIENSVLSHFTFFSNTADFYTSLSSTSSLSAGLRNSFTLGVTLDSTTSSVSGTSRKIKGTTLQISSINSAVSLIATCTHTTLELAPNFAQEFEMLSATIKKPWLEAEWSQYKDFLKKYGSHIVEVVELGTSIYQHCFSKETESYSQRQFKVKACANLAGPTNVGKVNVTACAGISKKETGFDSNIDTSSRLVVRGGSEETRALLYSSRTNENIEKLIKEAESFSQPVQYRFESVWELLMIRYSGTEHYAKARNLEAYYKGYATMSCRYRYRSNVVLQVFNHTKESTPAHPMYECKIPPKGCTVDNDCQYRAAFWCQCKGDSCIRYGKKAHSGDTHIVANPFTGDGWGWQGCDLYGLACYCVNNKIWTVIWKQGDNSKSQKHLYEK